MHNSEISRRAWMAGAAGAGLGAVGAGQEGSPLVDRRQRAGAEGDGLIIADHVGKVVRVGRALRLRAGLEKTTVYFDRVAEGAAGGSLVSAGPTPPPAAGPARLQWDDF